MIINEKIQSVLNKPYIVKGNQNKKYICWHLCRKVYALLGLRLQQSHSGRHELRRIIVPQVPCIVMFRAAMDWHSGVVYPDGLHFIHACSLNIFEPNPTEYFVCKDRLTAWPYKMIIEGYYSTEEM